MANKQTGKNINDILDLIGVKLDLADRRGIRFEIKNGRLLIDGVGFQSDDETRRYIELKSKARKGEIYSLLVAGRSGVSYRLLDGEDQIQYCPTFIYQEKQLVLEEVLDPKSSSEKLHKIKLMKEQLGILVKVIDYD